MVGPIISWARRPTAGGTREKKEKKRRGAEVGRSNYPMAAAPMGELGRVLPKVGRTIIMQVINNCYNRVIEL